MQNLSHFVLAHRRLIGLLTIVAVAVGGGALALVLANVSERNEYPGLPGYQANQKILQTYGTGGYERPYIPVITLPEGMTAASPQGRQVVAAAFAAADQATGGRVVSYADTFDRRFVGSDGRTTFGLVFGGPVEQGGLPGSSLGEGSDLNLTIDEAMRTTLPPGATLFVTGLDTLATGKDTGGLNVGVKLLFTIGAALVVLAWAFRSAMAVVPLLTALITLPVSLIGLLAASLLVPIHETTVMMIPLLGLGIAIDYALILVTRWREERSAGRVGDHAVHRSMATAGHSIVFSSVAVAIGLLAMIVLPIPIMRSLGVGGMVVTATSAVISLTVLPLILSWAGRRLDRRAAAGKQVRVTGYEQAGRFWSEWARTVIRHRWIVLIGSAATLGALVVVAFGINLNVPVTGNLAKSGPGYHGLIALQRSGIPSGALTSFDVYVPRGSDPSAVSNAIGSLPGVYAVTTPAGPDWRAVDGSALLTVLPADEGGSPAGRDTVERVRDTVPDGVLVGGNVTQQIDYVTATYAAFPWMLALIALITFVMLARAFGSVLLPLKAIALNLLSLGAVLGAMVLMWQWGWGTELLLGIQPDGTIGTFIPVTIFAFLYGLTMDYEVFIIARMREEYDRAGSTEQAIVQGIGHTGRLVTCAALILFFSFASMASGGELDVAVFASGVALGIILDATLIRSLLVPATVAMMGRWNWWLPTWLAKILRVKPSLPARQDGSGLAGTDSAAAGDQVDAGQQAA